MHNERAIQALRKIFMIGTRRAAILPMGRKKYEIYASELRTPITVEEASQRSANSVTAFEAIKVHEAELSSVKRLKT